jgi:ABC-2 type transport system ATP-binding protein
MSNSIITINNLSKSYRNGRTEKKVLHNISLSVLPGQIIGYIGPNGAGKSTTVKILSGIISDFEGDAQVAGYDIRTEPLKVKEHIGYIPENASLYETLSPMEFLQFVGQLHGMDLARIDDKAIRLLELFDLKQSAHERMNTFSKGMKQKVLIISGIIHNPDVIFMDEPLDGLDANSVIVVKEILMQLAREGKTIFYSSHIMDVVEKISDRIILINQGKVVADGSYAELCQGREVNSLEQLFTFLTGKSDHSQRAGEIIDILEQ